jgi:hypothetical protein
MYFGSLNRYWLSRCSLLGAGTSASCGMCLPQGLVVIGASRFMSFSPLRKMIRQAMTPFSSSRFTRTEWPSGAKSA